MSFNVNWNTLETELLRDYTQEVLTLALNSGKPPKILAAPIQIKDLKFGKVAPNFEILEIGELDLDRFRGIFEVNYSGDFELTLHTKVHANPLHIHQATSLEGEIGGDEDEELHRFVTPNFGVATEAFPLPLDLKLLDIRILGIGIIVFSRTKGLTLVFRNDPLDLILVTLTFDTVQVLAKFLQKQIENQIRDLFRETLPTLIHQLLLKFLNLDRLNRDLLSTLPSTSVVVAPAATAVQNTILPANCRKIIKIIQSRQTLALDIPKFKNIIQRSHLEKYLNQPSLLTSLMTDFDNNLPISTPAHQANGIPIDMLINDDVDKTEEILRAITTVQTTSYYTSSNKDVAKPRRRKIKLGGKKKAQAKVEVAPDANSTLDEMVTPASTPISLAKPVTPALTPMLKASEVKDGKLQHPRPLRISDELYQELMNPLDYHHHYHHHHPVDSPSIVSGVGIGNNYFNFTNQNRQTQSPVWVEVKLEKSTKSKNYLNSTNINDKLKREFAHHQYGIGQPQVLDTPPPYQL